MDGLKPWICPRCNAHNGPTWSGFVDNFCIRRDFDFYRGPVEKGYYTDISYIHEHGFCDQVYCRICSDRQWKEREEFEQKVKGTQDDLRKRFREGLITAEDFSRIFREIHGEEEDRLFVYNRRVPSLSKN
jgi:hypothetical protein